MKLTITNYYTMSSLSLSCIGGRGDWSSEGCYKQSNTDDRTDSITCYCDHFTHFAVIVVRVPNTTS